MWRDGLGVLSICRLILTKGDSKGLDYRHGTGHGVGHFLNVHEGAVASDAGKPIG